jgi:hypothetical protein
MSRNSQAKRLSADSIQKWKRDKFVIGEILSTVNAKSVHYLVPEFVLDFRIGCQKVKNS